MHHRDVGGASYQTHRKSLSDSSERLYSCPDLTSYAGLAGSSSNREGGAETTARFISHGRHRSNVSVASMDSLIEQQQHHQGSSASVSFLEDRLLDSPKGDAAKRRLYDEPRDASWLGSILGALGELGARRNAPIGLAGSSTSTSGSNGTGGRNGGSTGAGSAHRNLYDTSFSAHESSGNSSAPLYNYSMGNFAAGRSARHKDHRIDYGFFLFSAVIYCVLFYFVFFVDSQELSRSISPNASSKSQNIDAVIISLTSVILLSFFTWLLHALLFDLDGVIVGMFPAAVTFVCSFLFSVVRTQSREPMLALDILSIALSLGLLRRQTTAKAGDAPSSYRA